MATRFFFSPRTDKRKSDSSSESSRQTRTWFLETNVGQKSPLPKRTLKKKVTKKAPIKYTTTHKKKDTSNDFRANRALLEHRLRLLLDDEE